MPHFVATEFIKKKFSDAVHIATGKNKEYLIMWLDKEYVDLSICKQVITLLKQRENIYLHELLQGSSIYTQKKIVKPNVEFERLLAKRRAEDEERKYRLSVSNVSKPPAEKSPFKTFKGQFATGLDLIVTMFTFFCLFYYSTYNMVDDNWRLIAGGFGATCGLLMETILFIIRAEAYDRVDATKVEEKPEFKLTDGSRKMLEKLQHLKTIESKSHE
jgi:hypothetical protein